MEHIWRTGEELGPVSGDSTNKETLVFPGALLREYHGKAFVPLGVPSSSLGQARKYGRNVRVGVRLAS